MRSNAADYALIAPPTLTAVLEALASDSTLTPIAGGTELMVALSAGRLPQKNLLSINHLKELRFIDVTPDTITLGSGTTFTDIRNHPVIAADFPLLTQAARWTGSIANQNRGTLGGNIVNASPAADTPPALLAYDATLTLISAAGTRTMPYRLFHLGYKKTALAPDELLYSITIPRKFDAYRTYTRKVGTRNAQAISKVALACLALLENDVIRDIRIGAASLREVPTRCTAAEQALLNQSVTPATITAARAALATEARPIDDIRSTAKYRAAVAANLLEEFLRQLSRDQG
ncbi:MAG TPA: FAD binding domain-containing protein [Acidobacteriaceae bacterium]